MISGMHMHSCLNPAVLPPARHAMYVCPAVDSTCWPDCLAVVEERDAPRLWKFSGAVEGRRKVRPACWTAAPMTWTVLAVCD